MSNQISRLSTRVRALCALHTGKATTFLTNYRCLSTKLPYTEHNSDQFMSRHIGVRENELNEMLAKIGYNVSWHIIFTLMNFVEKFSLILNSQTIHEFIEDTIHDSIRLKRDLQMKPQLSENELIERLKEIAALNKHDWRAFIGTGYYNCFTPTPILRNIFENPGNWSSKSNPPHSTCFPRKFSS